MVGGSYVATSLQDAVDYRAKNPGIPLYGGGTDWMVEAPDEQEYLFLHRVPELRQISQDGDTLRIGAACTFTEVAEHPLCPAILREAILQIAAPAIRNLGTIGGNIGNGSAKADTALVFFAADAKLRIVGQGGDRLIPIQSFYKGRKELDLGPDELIAEVLLPTAFLNRYYYQKVGARNALAISRVSFAGLMDLQDGVIRHCATAFGAITQVILRREDLDAMLIGKTVEQAKALKADYLAAFDEAIQPIRGRISAEYRKDVCLGLLGAFLEHFGI